MPVLLRITYEERSARFTAQHLPALDQSLPRALAFILCAACGSVVLLHTARDFDYFVVIEIALWITRHRSLKQLVD